MEVGQSKFLKSITFLAGVDMVAKKKVSSKKSPSSKKSASGSDLATLSPVQVKQLEKKLTAFLTNVKTTGKLPARFGNLAGHGSHAQD